MRVIDGVQDRWSTLTKRLHGIEDTIDETCRIVGAKTFGYFDGFIDADSTRDVVTVHDFISAEPKNGAVNGVNPFWAVVLDHILEFFVNGVFMC